MKCPASQRGNKGKNVRLQSLPGHLGIEDVAATTLSGISVVLSGDSAVEHGESMSILQFLA